MGNYINPKDMSKEEFISIHCKQITDQEFIDLPFSKDSYGIVWVNNGPFSSAIVCNTKRELQYIQLMMSKEDRNHRCYTLDSKLAKGFITEK